MPKLKTHKATAKRFKIKKRGKIIRRQTGQDHFNAGESGQTTMGKRRDVSVAEADVRNIRRLIPYN